MKGTINDHNLATALFTLALMCTEEGTDNCDLTLTSLKGTLHCHIEFTGELDYEAYN